MEWTSLNDLREKFLSFFESKGHLRLPSFPLVPKNDNSLLLINSGMAPMKKYFTREITPPRDRVTTCQKCIRTPDLERVGKTARHGTYFEMLGNFSFGDYFKNEAIPWAWEFLTETLKIPADLLWPSVYESDDEAYAIWRDVIGVPEERIVRLGKEDNFWEHGTGPCGPCSEIYFDRGEKYGCGSPDCKPGCDCDRYMEIWNNVFTQFDNLGNGEYAELERKNIDTGMGLERLACVMQGVDNMFEVDTIRKILDKVCEISGKKYGSGGAEDVSIRAITDHARASAFMICDGIFPSNEGRGYVLRRLIRRAARHGRLIGINRPFLTEVCETVIGENEGAYPELREKKELIMKVLANEEAAFAKTIDAGLAIINEKTSGGAALSGEDAFRLYDTYGFPFDLTRDILEEKGLTADEETFNRLMDEQRAKARAGRKAADAESWKSDGVKLDGVKPTQFCGYTEEKCEAKVVAVIADGERTEAAGEGSRAILILDKTPFYGEGGGQVGDTGIITDGSAVFTVENTTKTPDGVFMHMGRLEGGAIETGDTVTAGIDSARRAAIRRNHTAAHLLQAALRRVLGTHVEQAGQLVNEKAVRFDFTHFSGLSPEELTQVETLVNNVILSAKAVANTEMPIDEAKKLGAMALFGEKYGDIVRVVDVPGFSTELCGGTHVKNTAEIGLFKILSEASVASGVRRIEAVTGTGVLDLINNYEAAATQTAAALKLNNTSEIPEKVRQLTEELKAAERKAEALNSKLASAAVEDMFKNAEQIGSVHLITARLSGVTGAALRDMGDKIRDRDSSAVAVLVSVSDSSATIAVAAGKDAVAAGVMSGKAVGAIAAVAGGRGGGKPDFAMAGAKDLSKIGDALAAAEDIISDMVK